MKQKFTYMIDRFEIQIEEGIRQGWWWMVTDTQTGNTRGGNPAPTEQQARTDAEERVAEIQIFEATDSDDAESYGLRNEIPMLGTTAPVNPPMNQQVRFVEDNDDGVDFVYEDPAPDPDDLTNEDIRAMLWAEHVDQTAKAGEMTVEYALTEHLAFHDDPDKELDQRRRDYDRGKLLSKYYRLVSSARREIGAQHPIPKGAIVWDFFSAGYIAMVEASQIIGIAKK